MLRSSSAEYGTPITPSLIKETSTPPHTSSASYLERGCDATTITDPGYLSNDDTLSLLTAPLSSPLQELTWEDAEPSIVAKKLTQDSAIADLSFTQAFDYWSQPALLGASQAFLITQDQAATPERGFGLATLRGGRSDIQSHGPALAQPLASSPRPLRQMSDTKCLKRPSSSFESDDSHRGASASTTRKRAKVDDTNPSDDCEDYGLLSSAQFETQDWTTSWSDSLCKSPEPDRANKNAIA